MSYFSLSDKTQEKKNVSDANKFSQVFGRLSNQELLSSLMVVVCEKCSVSLFVLLSVGKRAPSVCGKDDGVQTLVRSHDMHNQTPHTDIKHKRA
jgi:hypothetical protein